MSKYRKLAPDMHPDRFLDPAQKKKAEEKLKKLNHAKDVLNDHFKGPRASHIGGDSCMCRPTKATGEQSAQTNSGSRTDQAARAAAEETARKNAAEATKAAVKKAAEEAARKAAAETAQKAKQAAAEAAARNAAEAKKRAEEAEQVAAAAAAAAKEAAEDVQAGLVHNQQKQSEIDRWSYAKACAFLFAGILTFAAATQFVKGAIQGHRSQLSATTPSPATQTQAETKEQEDRFYAKEKERLADDAQHRYDPEIDECLNQISQCQQKIQGWQREIERLHGEPPSDQTTRAISALRRQMYEASLYWKSANDRLDRLQLQHPEIASDRISKRPAPPIIQLYEPPPSSPHGSPVLNQNITQDTEKTRRGLI
jgi:hypothetical protein